MSEQTQEEKKPLLARLFKDMMNPEQRALYGFIFFVLTFVFVLWVGYLDMAHSTTRLEVFLNQYEGRSIERGAVLYANNCASCHGDNGQGQVGVAPAINYEGLFDGSRAAETDWTGTMQDYVQLTVAAGRPVKSCSIWPQVMPTWGQEYGGPLRPDQVRDVTAFVMNWSKDPLTREEVAQPPLLASSEECGGAGPVAPGDEEAALMMKIEMALAVAELEGNTDHGEAVFLGNAPGLDGQSYACQSCHSLDGSVLVGPSMEGIAGRVPYDDYELPPEAEEAGVDPTIFYLVEAIWWPNDYIVEGFENVVMPNNFMDRMDEDPQELADIIDWLLELGEQ